MSQSLRCPGGSEYGHGMSLTVIHAGGCCKEWRKAMLRILGSLAHGYALAHSNNQAWLVTDPIHIIPAEHFRQLAEAGLVVSYGVFNGTEVEYYEITDRGLLEYRNLKKG